MSVVSQNRYALIAGAVLSALAAVSAANAQSAPPPNSPQGCTREEYDLNADCAQRHIKPNPKSPKESAPIDLTGYWVSIVSEEWRWRMMTPPKGDRASMPLNLKAEEVMNQWDPKNPQPCKAFGPPGMIRQPMRVRFTWTDDQQLRMESDHGQVTRDFRFGTAASAKNAPSAQGDSVARWEEGALKVVTDNLTPGFLRRNGVPYSEQTVLTEYFDRYSAAGNDYLTVISIVKDPVYLTREFVVSTDFKKLADGSAWHPAPCDAPVVLPTRKAR